jgi:hypothetical protein
MEGPDGFTGVGTPMPSRVHVPRFVPAFEEQRMPKSTSKPTSANKTERVISRPQYTLPCTVSEHRTPLSKSNLKKPVSKMVPKTLSLAKPLSKANLKQLETPTAAFVKSENSSVDLCPRKPPISSVESPSNASTSSSLLRLQPPLPMRPPETPSKPHHTLKSLGLPPLPSKLSTTSVKSMRTISTTHIARRNDLSTDSGKAELASIFLHDQHPEILTRAEDDEDGNFSLGVSPQKMGRTSKGKGKEPKFVRYDKLLFSFIYYNLTYCRNGLAARASMLFSQTHTALALWQKEIENLLSSSSLSRRLTPDLRLRIVKIINVPVGSGSRRSVTSTTSPGLAICRVLSTSSGHKHTSHSLPGNNDDKTLLVLLSFPTTAPLRTNTLHARNPEDFLEGRDVYVWEPWQEVPLFFSSPVTGASMTVEDAKHLNIAAAPFPLLPSSFPLSPTSTRVKEEFSSDIPLADTALLCSRFLIMQ